MGATGVFTGLSGASFEGYEIHMGRTAGALNFARLTQGEKTTPDGMAVGNVWGSYVHGIFDKGEFAQRFVNCLLKAKGLSEAEAVEDWASYKERQYDILADACRAALDMDKIYEILEEGI